METPGREMVLSHIEIGYAANGSFRSCTIVFVNVGIWPANRLFNSGDRLGR